MKTNKPTDVSRHRLTLLSIVGAYPTIIAVLTVLNPWLDDAPLPIKAVVVVPLMVGLPTYVVLPAFTLVFVDWLVPAPNSNSATQEERYRHE